MDSSILSSGLNLDSKGFKQLLDSQSLVDCTLACDGGKISAHKVVLSACSSYLAKILFEHPVDHPIIILPELKIEDVKTLVHYMYTGELLKSDTLNSVGLLRTAAILSVNSLNDFLNSAQLNHSPINPATATAPSVLNHPMSITSPMSVTVPLLSSAATTAPASTITSPNDTKYFPISNTFTSSNTTNGSKSEFQFKCPVCQNDFQTICSFEYHMQRVHNVTSFGCEICHKPFASLRYVLTDHMRRCHGWMAEQKLHC